MSLLSKRNPPPSAPSSPRRPLHRFSKVVEDIKSRRQSFAAHAGMSLCVVEFMASSPIGWLPVFPPSPRVSPDLLRKRTIHDPAPADAASPPISPTFHTFQSQMPPSSPPPAAAAAAPPAAVITDQMASQTNCMISNRRKIEHECKLERATSAIVKKTPNSVLDKGKWGQAAKLSMLMMVVVVFLSMGKTAALGITSTAFLVLRLIWNVRICCVSLFCHFHLASFISVRSPEKQAGKFAKKEEVCNAKLAMEEFAEKEDVCNIKLAAKEGKKGRLAGVARSLSVQMPCKKFSPLTVSAPSTPTTTSLFSPNAVPRSLNRLITGEPPFSTPGSPVPRIGSVGNFSCLLADSETSPLSKVLSRQNCGIDSRQQSNKVVSTMRKGSRLGELAKMNDSILRGAAAAAGGGGYYSMVVAILVILGGLLLGRMPAVIAVCCWMLVHAKLRGGKDSAAAAAMAASKK